MYRVLLVLFLLVWSFNRPIHCQEQKKAPSGHYLLAWTGDAAATRCTPICPPNKGNDFLVVIDADPASPSYGHLVTTVATDQQTMYAHHTEYTMPASGMLFANDHDAGRTFIFDVRDPLHPTVKTSFTEMVGYMHPHSCDRRHVSGCGAPTLVHRCPHSRSRAVRKSKDATMLDGRTYDEMPIEQITTQVQMIDSQVIELEASP